jgi:hypothetical protein
VNLKEVFDYYIGCIDPPSASSTSTIATDSTTNITESVTVIFPVPCPYCGRCPHCGQCVPYHLYPPYYPRPPSWPPAPPYYVGDVPDPHGGWTC